MFKALSHWTATNQNGQATALTVTLVLSFRHVGRKVGEAEPIVVGGVFTKMVIAAWTTCFQPGVLCVCD